MSENIQVRSILGRFLEHSRVFNFEAKTVDVWLLGSADLMPRNLDHRLEVVVPVEDGVLQQRLAGAFDVLLAGQRRRLGARPRTARGRGFGPRTTSRPARRRRF